MKKIPTLYEIEYDGRKQTGMNRTPKPEFAWVEDGEGIATTKIDGSCCAIINGKFYKRYDAKRGRKPPKEGIRCQAEPDPITGHFPYWVPVSETKSADRWLCDAYSNMPESQLLDGTYEAIGPKFNSNRYFMRNNILVKHGELIRDVQDRTWDGIRSYLAAHYIEGLVFWKDGNPECKIRRKDFGFNWGDKSRGLPQYDFCPECRKWVPINYTSDFATRAFCAECGSELWPFGLIDSNIERGAYER